MLDESGKPVGEENWWWLSTPGTNGSFHLVVRVEVLTLMVLFYIWEEVKVAGRKVGAVRREWQNLLELQALQPLLCFTTCVRAGIVVLKNRVQIPSRLGNPELLGTWRCGMAVLQQLPFVFGVKMMHP